MSLVSAMIRGEQAYEPSHQIRDHFQTILEVHLPCFDEELPLACVSLSITWVGRPAQPSEQLGACWAVATFGLVLLRRLVFRRRDLEYSTGLRATERVSRELTTAPGKQAAHATVGVLG